MTKAYVSTRNKTIQATDSEAVLLGLSEDGGLFVPNNIDKIKINLKNLLDLEYREVSEVILKEFFPDFTEKQLKNSIYNAYDDKFDTKEITPLKKIGNYYFSELYHGKTLAFKDVALSILPYLMKAAKENQKQDKEILILTATSGDTGKAALEGFKDVNGINIAVFYPEGGVSKIQELQMKTQEGENTYVYAVKGNFDDAQNMVKEVFNDEKIKNELYKNGVVLSSANSINIGRLIPQIVYYVTSYVKLVNEKTISLGDRINFTVPTGNFGNILAGYIAKKIGLPINKLICAANENNVLTDFINTGEYNIERKFIKTISPSMDILISSNLERLLYFLSNEDDAYINKLMKDLKNDKKYKVSKNIQNDIKKLFWSDFSTEEETLASIKNLYKNLGYVIDTHTAVAVDVYNKYKNETNDKTINVILSTASPFKFIESVYFAVESKKIDNNANIIEEFSKRFELEIPKEILNLENKKHKHNEILEIKNVEEKIIKISEKIRG